jgi:PAS domain S-box-containing protein
MQFRERFHDLIFDREDSDISGVATLKKTLMPHPPNTPENPLESDYRDRTVPSPDILFEGKPCADPAHTLSTRALRNPSADPGLTAPIRDDPDLMWLDDALIENLIVRLYPKDPLKPDGTLSHRLGNTTARPKKAGEWDSLVQSADRARYPVFAIDRSRIVIAWNTAIEQLTGIPRHEMIGKSAHAYAIPFYGSARSMLIDYAIVPPDIAKILDPVPATRDGETFIGEMEEAHINGNPVHMWGRASRIYDAAGKVTAAVQSIGIAMNLQPAVSERDEVIWRKQAELHSAFEKLATTQEELLLNYRDLTQTQQQLIESERKLRTQEAFLKCVISDAREGIVAYDCELRYILWNRFMENLTGMPATEVLGKGAIEMFPRLKLAGADHLLERALAGETVESSDFSLLVPRSGKQNWVKVIYSPLTDTNGGVFGVIGIVQDTTARKVMEYALQTTIVQLVESESKYRNVFNAKTDPLLLIDPDSCRILDLNDAAAGVYGYTRDAMLAMSVPDLYAEPDETCQTPALPVPQVWTGYHRKKDGSLFPVDVSSAYVDVKGHQVQILSVRDLSSVQRIADALRLANTKLNLLMGITRHDVLNNLTAVMGYNSLMKRDISDSGIVDMLDKQETALKTMRHQIEFTREYDELGVKAPRWQNLNDVASRSYAQFMNTVEFSCTTGDLEIYADPMLERVFCNLFDNTFRYGEGTSHIQLSFIRDDPDLLVVFEDNGPGIAEENKDRIFVRGYGRHTGLGLFLAREILAITRIEIRETGEYLKGARFELRVPRGSYRFTGPADPGSGKDQDETSLPVFFNKIREKPRKRTADD